MPVPERAARSSTGTSGPTTGQGGGARAAEFSVFLGIESGDDGVLQNMNKRATAAQLRAGTRMLLERGIPTFACFIVGFPGETAETVANTMRFIEETAPTFFRAELHFHDPKAPIQQRAQEFGLRSRAFNWSHHTMRWQEAQEHVYELYRRIDRSVVLPIVDFDFWSLPYYEGMGLPLQRIKRFAEVAREMLVASLDDQSVPLETYEHRLAQALLDEQAPLLARSGAQKA